MKTDYQRLADYFLSVGQHYDTWEDFKEKELWLIVHNNCYVFTLEGTFKHIETA